MTYWLQPRVYSWWLCQGGAAQHTSIRQGVSIVERETALECVTFSSSPVSIWKLFPDVSPHASVFELGQYYTKICLQFVKQSSCVWQHLYYPTVYKVWLVKPACKTALLSRFSCGILTHLWLISSSDVITMQMSEWGICWIHGGFIMKNTDCNTVFLYLFSVNFPDHFSLL